jgi:putative membrane protein
LEKVTELAYDRTWLAFERTLQAWVRTAMSSITFGFSVYKLADLVNGNGNPQRLAGPHELGTFLVALGFLALAMATLEYRQNIKMLRLEYGKSPRSLSVWFAGSIALLGIFALLDMLFAKGS